MYKFQRKGSLIVVTQSRQSVPTLDHRVATRSRIITFGELQQICLAKNGSIDMSATITVAHKRDRKEERTIESTMLGSAKVDKSPKEAASPSPDEILRRIRLMIYGSTQSSVSSQPQRIAREREREADLSRTSLGQIADEHDSLGSSKGSNSLSDLENELLHQGHLISVVKGKVGLHGDVGDDGRSSELIGNLLGRGQHQCLGAKQQ